MENRLTRPTAQGIAQADTLSERRTGRAVQWLSSMRGLLLIMSLHILTGCATHRAGVVGDEVSPVQEPTSSTEPISSEDSSFILQVLVDVLWDVLMIH